MAFSSGSAAWEFFPGRFCKAAVTPPYEGRELIRQLDEVGSKSLPLVAMAGAAIGVISRSKPATV